MADPQNSGFQNSELSFGTDGVRGRAFSQLTLEYVERLGHAAATVLSVPSFAIGWDTRESSPALAAAFAQGAKRSSAVVTELGVVATPVVSHFCETTSSAGAMVSASHNPWQDNGLKLFARGGTKLNETVEQQLADFLRAPTTGIDPTETARQNGTGSSSAAEPSAPLQFQPTSAGVAALATYEASLAASIEDRRLDGIHIVLDTAAGAASGYAAGILSALGAQVTPLFDEPNGRNINLNCGSLHPEQAQRVVLDRGADLGLCLDGDGDRLIAVDNTGQLINGDRLLVLFARDLSARGALAHRTLVTTVMANLGLREALAADEIAVHETPVGDRYVLGALDSGGFDLGGEQSGHIIFRRSAATGDGLRSGIHLADLVLRSGQSSAELASRSMTEYPQLLKNVRLRAAESATEPAEVAELLANLDSQIAEIADTAGAHTRVLVRPSGTEPLVRVMVEAASLVEAEALADRLVALVEAAISR